MVKRTRRGISKSFKKSVRSKRRSRKSKKSRKTKKTISHKNHNSKTASGFRDLLKKIKNPRRQSKPPRSVQQHSRPAPRVNIFTMTQTSNSILSPIQIGWIIHPILRDIKLARSLIDQDTFIPDNLNRPLYKDGDYLKNDDLGANTPTKLARTVNSYKHILDQTIRLFQTEAQLAEYNTKHYQQIRDEAERRKQMTDRHRRLLNILLTLVDKDRKTMLDIVDNEDNLEAKNSIANISHTNINSTDSKEDAIDKCIKNCKK